MNSLNRVKWLPKCGKLRWSFYQGLHVLLRSTILSWQEGGRTDSPYFSTFYIFHFFPAPRSFASERSVESTPTIFETFAYELETYLRSTPIFALLVFLRFFAIFVLSVRRENLRTPVGTRRLLSFVTT